MKKKILLLHGALGSEKQFTSIITSLADEFEVHRMNFEGHGGSGSDKAFSIQLFSNNVINYLNNHSIENINIFGYSMGGYVALYVARHFPEKINSVITLGTKFSWDLVSAQKEIKMLNPEKIEEKVPQFAKKLKVEHSPMDWKINMRKTAQMMLGMAEGAKLQDADFKVIHHQVTLGLGTMDKMVSLEETQYVSDLLAHSKIVQLDNVKHPIEQVDPDMIIEFIKQQFQ